MNGFYWWRFSLCLWSRGHAEGSHVSGCSLAWRKGRRPFYSFEGKRLGFQERVRRPRYDFCNGPHPSGCAEDSWLFASCYLCLCRQSLPPFLPLEFHPPKFHNDEFKILCVPSHSMVSDLHWRYSVLSFPSITWLFCPRGPLQDPGLYVNASTSWGIGIVIGELRASFQHESSWLRCPLAGDGCYWTSCLLLETIYFSDAYLLTYSDSQDTIGAIWKGRSSNTYINISIRCTYFVLITPNIVYVESKANPGNPIESRGLWGTRASCLDKRFSSATCVVEMSVGRRGSTGHVPPCPIGFRISFHPFRSSFPRQPTLKFPSTGSPFRTA